MKSNTHIHIRNTTSDRVFVAVNYTLLTLLFLVVLYPIVYVVSSSFSDAKAVLAGRVVLFPVKPSLEGYRAVFRYRDVWVGYGNTVFYTVVGTLVNLTLTMMAAYPLSRRDFVGRDLIMFIFTFTMFFSGGIIPTYLLVKNLGLLNTRWAMILPVAMSVWNVIITRTYLQATIPSELYDSGRMDGASNTRMLVSIVLPLSKPVIAVIALFYAVFHWNAFFNALIYLRSKTLYPLQLVLQQILIENSPVQMTMMQNLSAQELQQMTEREYLQALLQYALIVVSSLPVLVVYPFLQKYFVQGVMIGAIKG